MAKVPQPTGRPKVSSDLQALHMMRAHYEQCLAFPEVAPLFGVSKSTAHLETQKTAKLYPEFKYFLTELSKTEEKPDRKAETIAHVAQQQMIQTEQQYHDRFELITSDLAKAIEETVGHLLDMDPSELKKMKTEHKLRHIPELIKTARLLRDQSTENVQKISLIKAVGIATARRKVRTGTE